MKPDDVLWTKLSVPRRPAAFVARADVAGRLDRALADTGVTLLCAPAGFGKSVLLADACDRSEQAVARVSLDERDSDPLRFWRHVGAALDQALGDTSHVLDSVDQALRGRDDRGRAGAMAVLNALSPDRRGTVLALDDYHLVEQDEIHAGLAYLLDHAPAALHVAVAARVEPPLALARLRVAGVLTEIRGPDLRFTPEDGARLLGALAGDTVDRAAASVMVDRTEGWAAGLQLAGMSLRGRDDVEAFVSSFSGEHRFVLDYLAEEVIDREPEEVQEFLVQTAVLERLSGPVCDAVTGRTDGQEMLEYLERSNLFVVSLDDRRTWWRYHHLFAEQLRGRLERDGRHDAAAQHRRAAAWWEAEGHVDQAIHHLLDAGELGRAAELVEAHADDLLFRAENATLARWFERLPDATVASRRLALVEARIAVYGGRLTEADRLLDRSDDLADRPVESGDGRSTPGSVGPLTDPDATAILLRAFVAHMRGHGEEAMALARPLAPNGPARSPLELIAAWHLATGPWLSGAVADAEPLLERNVQGWLELGAVDRAAWTTRYLAHVQRAVARDSDAAHSYGRILELRHADAGDDPARGVAHVGLAELAYERNDLDTARTHARLGISMCTDFVNTQVVADGWCVLARIEAAAGDDDAARQAAAMADLSAPSADVAALLDPVPARLAELASALGEPERAARFRRAHPIEDDPGPHSAEPADVAAARLLIDDDRAKAAVPLLAALHQRAHDQGRIGVVTDIEVLQAAASAALGDEGEATRLLATALVRAQPEGRVRIFADAGPRVRDIASRVVAAGSADTPDRIDPAFLRSIAAACGLTRAEDTAPMAHSGMVVPLSDRELEVLGEIARGHPNREVADRLYISLNTVKKHVTHIFEKLGVTNRTAAVARGRELGLVA